MCVNAREVLWSERLPFMRAGQSRLQGERARLAREIRVCGDGSFFVG